MDTKLLGLILQGDKKNEQEFNRIKETYEEMSNSKAHVIASSANGESIVLSDSSDSKLDNLRVLGKSEQFTTTGAQLVDASKIVTTSTVGLTTIVNSDGSLTINGTPSQAYAPAAYFTNMLLEPGIYYISGGQNAVGCVYAQMNITLSDGTFKHYINKAFEIDGTEQKVILYIQTGADLNTINNYTIYPMLNKGSTALPYEPYTGGIPSPNPQYPQEIVSAGDDGEVEVGVYGGNLFDKNNAKYVSSIACESQTLHFYDNNNQHVRMYYMDAEPNTSYFIGKTVGINLRVCTCPEIPSNDGKITHINANTSENSCVMTTGSEDNYIAFYLLWTAEVDSGITYESVIDTLMVAKGDTYIPYEPYKPAQPLTISTPNGLPGIKVTDPSIATYTDEAGQMWCADEVDFERGVYVKRIGKVDITRDRYKRHDFYETYNKFSFGTDILYDTDNYTSRTLPTLSNKFVANPRNIIGCFDSLTISNGGWQGYVRSIFVVDKSVASLDDFMNYVGDDCFVMIPLKEPIETPLSESELAAYKVLHTNYPNTTILNDSGAHMEVKYTADKKSYIDNKFAQITNAVLSMGSNV